MRTVKLAPRPIAAIYSRVMLFRPEFPSSGDLNPRSLKLTKCGGAGRGEDCQSNPKSHSTNTLAIPRKRTNPIASSTRLCLSALLSINVVTAP